MNTLTRRVAAAAAVVSLAAVPVTAVASPSASHSTSLRSKAEKYCKAQEKKLGTKKFEKKYGKTKALGKCVSQYEKTHKK